MYFARTKLGPRGYSIFVDTESTRVLFILRILQSARHQLHSIWTRAIVVHRTSWNRGVWDRWHTYIRLNRDYFLCAIVSRRRDPPKIDLRIYFQCGKLRIHSYILLRESTRERLSWSDYDCMYRVRSVLRNDYEKSPALGTQHAKFWAGRAYFTFRSESASRGNWK